MGAFVDQVRSGKIPQPTQVTFGVDVWRKSYEVISGKDTADAHLFDAGLFFNDIFGRLRDKLAEGNFRRLGRRARLTAICGLINHEVAVLARKTRESSPEPGSTIPLPSIIEKTVTLRSGIKVTPDQLITVLLDSVVYPLDEALQASEEGTALARDSFGEIGLAFTIANLYRSATEYWHECLWGGKFVDRQPSARVLIRPEDVSKARQEAVSDQRDQAQLFTGAQYCARIWRDRLTTVAKKAMVIEKGDVLGTMVDAVMRRIQNKQSDREWFLAHAVLVPRTEIKHVLARALTLDENTLSSAIDFLTYQRRSDGLWQKPLIPLNESEFLVAAAPLRYGNRLRIAERWLSQGGFDLGRRGPVFETLARGTFSEFLKESPFLNDYYVAPNPVFVGPDREEVDLLVRIGRLLLVGEAKCQLFPAEPLEAYRFRERLKEGAVQATRKVVAVQSSLAELQSIVGLPSLEGISVIPFVLSNHILGSGYPIHGVPIVDLLYLGTLLQQGYFRTMVIMGREGAEDPGNLVRFYTDQADAERRIPKLLVEQPVVRIFEPLIKRRIRPIPIDLGGAEIFSEYYAVSLEVNPVDFDPRSLQPE
jgi:hypothetical protein